MEPFESGKNLASWAGISLGNNITAGKTKSRRIKKANPSLLSALCPAGRAGREHETASFEKHHRWSHKLGLARANVAMSRNLLMMVYQVLSTGQPYREPDATQLHEMEKRKLVRHHAKRLRELGADEERVQQLVHELIEPAAPAPTANSPSPLPASTRVQRSTKHPRSAGDSWDSEHGKLGHNNIQLSKIRGAINLFRRAPRWPRHLLPTVSQHSRSGPQKLQRRGQQLLPAKRR
jgi:hypothetical protein